MARSYFPGLLCFALLASAASATQFRVGGASGWSVPDAGDEPYNAWAGRMRFQIGDQLLFVYPKETDSVLIVADPSAYDACNTAAATNKFDDGNTVFTFDRSGPFFFISGNETNCRAGEKLIVVVMSADHSPPPAVSPPPSAMPPQSAAPMPSPSSSPPSMLPPSAAPVPSPMSPPSMPPPSGAPTSSPPSEAPAMPAPAATPGSAPSPTGSAPGSAPTANPGSPPSPPGTPATPGTPGGAPSGSGNTPGAPDTTAPPGNGAAPAAAGLVSTLAACVGYAILAI